MIHVNYFHDKAGSEMPQLSKLLLHLPPQTPSSEHHPGDPTQAPAFTASSFNPTEPSNQSQFIHIFGLAAPWRIQSPALPQRPVSPVSYPSTPLREGHVFTPCVYRRERERQAGSSQGLSYAMNLDILLHSRFQSWFSLP